MWRLGTGAFLDGLRVLDTGALVAALGIGAATTVLSAWRWCLVARGLGMRLTLKDATADYYQALFLNAALPGGILGDVGRAVRHGKDSGDLGRGVRAVVLERTAGMIVLLVVGAAVLVTVPSPVFDLLHANGARTAAVTAGIASAGVLVFLGMRRLRRGRSKAAGAARAGMSEIRAGLLSWRSGPGVLLASAAALAGHLATFLVAARAAGSVASLLELAPLLLLALLAMGLPINVGGWGPREGVMAWAFGAAGLSAAQGLTIAVAYGILAFVAAIPGAVVLVVRLVARRAEKPRTAPALTPAIAAAPASPLTLSPAIAAAHVPAMAPAPIIVPLPAARVLRAAVRVEARRPAYSGGVPA
ncbi:lysylphosphatidylglycerol synthase transmembrane domain-containing protein [Actinoplanes sandaracinus]